MHRPAERRTARFDPTATRRSFDSTRAAGDGIQRSRRPRRFAERLRGVVPLRRLRESTGPQSMASEPYGLLRETRQSGVRRALPAPTPVSRGGRVSEIRLRELRRLRRKEHRGPAFPLSVKRGRRSRRRTLESRDAERALGARPPSCYRRRCQRTGIHAKASPASEVVRPSEGGEEFTRGGGCGRRPARQR